MKVRTEIIAVGTELLLGQIVNTNASFLSEQLAGKGFEVYYQSVVGDNPTRLHELLKIAEKRSDLIILCGGLGPTDDDLTKGVVAQHLHLSLDIYQPALTKIKEHMRITKRNMTSNNHKQALVLEGSQVIENPNGFAVGDLVEKDGIYYLLLPGPPNELNQMFTEKAMPILQSIIPQNTQLVSRVLRFYGIGESQLVTTLADLIHEQSNPTIAPYAKQDEVTLRLTGKGENLLEINQMLNEVEREIMVRCGKYFYGRGDENSLERKVVEMLIKENKTVTSAESLTGGLFQSKLTSIPGASTIFNGGFIAYSLEMKSKLLTISTTLLKEKGVVSEECAMEMAENARKIMNADFGISFTGVAGPEKLEGNEVGTVWIGLSQKGKTPTAKLYHFGRSRLAIRQSAVMAGLDLLRKELLK